MLLNILFILATWLVALLVFCGWGLLWARIFNLKKINLELLCLLFWVGWATTLLLLQFWHIFWPVNAVAGGLVFFVGITIFCRFVRQLSVKMDRCRLVIGMVLVLFAIWLANRAMGPIGVYDTGLYHLNALRWITDYALVPGLGNLHGRLAFNSSYFLFPALLDIGPWSHMAHHLANGLLLLVVGGQLVHSLMQIFEGSARRYHFFAAVFIVPFARLSFVHASSLAPDLPIFLLGIVISFQVAKVLFSAAGTQDFNFIIFSVFLLIAVSVAVKLSFIILGMFYGLIILVKLIQQYKGYWRRRLMLYFIPPVVILITWMARGVVLSGYIAYPATVGAFDVDWKVPVGHVVLEAKWIQSWARDPKIYNHPDEVLNNWDWLGPWGRRIAQKSGLIDVVLPLSLMLVAAFISILYRKKVFAPAWILLLPACPALVFWFLTAPDPRFAGAAFWILAGGAICGIHYIYKYRQIFIIGVLFLATLTFAAHVQQKGFWIQSNHAGGFCPVPERKMLEFETNTGLVLYHPTSCDQCWDAPLPCTPYPNPHLYLRKKGSIQGGFAVSSPEPVH